ncbi:MAG: hypothetical protein ACFHWZ_07285 [Phycisphaerales bacterium]
MDAPKDRRLVSTTIACLICIVLTALLVAVGVRLWSTPRGEVVSYQIVLSQDGIESLGEVLSIDHPSNLVNDPPAAGLVKTQAKAKSGSQVYENETRIGTTWLNEYEGGAVELEFTHERAARDRFRIRIDSDFYVRLVVIETDSATGKVNAVSELLVPPGEFEHFMTVRERIDFDDAEELQPGN